MLPDFLEWRGWAAKESGRSDRRIPWRLYPAGAKEIERKMTEEN